MPINKIVVIKNKMRMKERKVKIQTNKHRFDYNLSG